MDITTIFTGVLGCAVAALSWMVRHWMVRVDAKVEKLLDGRMGQVLRTDCKECAVRLHSRLDEIDAKMDLLSERQTSLDIQVGVITRWIERHSQGDFPTLPVLPVSTRRKQ